MLLIIGRTLLFAFNRTRLISFRQVNTKFLRFRLHHPDVLVRVAVHLFVASVAQQDAVAYRLPKFRKTCQGQDMMQLHAVVVHRLIAVRAASALAFVQLALVVDHMVLCRATVHQVADRSLLHPAVGDVEVQAEGAELLRPSPAPVHRLIAEWWGKGFYPPTQSLVTDCVIVPY